MNMSSSGRTLAAILIGLVIEVGVSNLGIGQSGAIGNANAQAAASKHSVAAARVSKGLSDDFSDMFESIVQSVATVRVNKTSAYGTSIEELLRKHSPGFDGEAPKLPKNHGKSEANIGSGFFISNDGLFITNAHVVSGASRIILRLHNKKDVEASVVGMDERTDIALLRVPGGPYKPAPIGDSSKLKIGQWAIAVGSPFGFEASATLGIVSAKGRTLPDENYLPFIQTDAAVNPGNSGGPLLNSEGRVIGVNTQIYSRSGGYMGISFAIPIEHAMDVAGRLAKNGRIRHGRLGASVQDASGEIAAAMGVESGAIVSSVAPDSAASKAGLKPGDAIVGVAGKTVESASDLVMGIASREPGDRVELSVVRNGKRTGVFAVLGDSAGAEKTLDAALEPSAPPPPDGASGFGLAVRPISKDEAASSGTEGVVVVGANALALSKGIVIGDIVAMIDGEETPSISAFEKSAKSKKRIAAILVQRGDSSKFIALPRDRQAK